MPSRIKEEAILVGWHLHSGVIVEDRPGWDYENNRRMMVLSLYICASFRNGVSIFGWTQKWTKKVTPAKKQPDHLRHSTEEI
jgi:hypothetical protein